MHLEHWVGTIDGLCHSAGGTVLHQGILPDSFEHVLRDIQNGGICQIVVRVSKSFTFLTALESCPTQLRV